MKKISHWGNEIQNHTEILSMLSEQQSPIKQDPAKTGYEPWEKNTCAPLVGQWISSPST